MGDTWRAPPEKNPVKLWERTPGFDPALGQDEPTVTPYLLGGQGNGCVIVFPGGGYCVKAAHEAEPIALRMNALGFSAFVLDYRVSPYRFPHPQADAARAVRHVRFHAAKYGIQPGRIAVLGFSAGGHLAACAGVYWDRGDANSPDPIEMVSSRPDAMVLCYPVIKFFGGLRHEGSAVNLLGDGPDPDIRRSLTPSLHVTKDTAPAFLWHTAEDSGVPAANSVEMFRALRACGVTAELHIFPKGEHGLGLAQGDPQVSAWTGLCAGFLNSIFAEVSP
jgi:acetyl esterase/lipase